MTIQELPKDKTYGLILANINKNTLLKEISEYVEYLETEGELLLSGFYETDLDDIKEVTESSSLTFVNYKTQNNWVAAKFKKE
jgi:ribosomal protein L11 methyltransferase